MTGSIAWLHVGDLHADAADGWLGVERLGAIVSGIAEHGVAADFLFLPGDNANHGTAEQYSRIVDALAPLDLPWRVIPGDHDFEPGDLLAYEAAILPVNRPRAEVIAGHRCVFLDIVSAGAGGPDFRLAMGERRRLGEELARATAEGTPPLAFLHAYPGDLAADGADVARVIADTGIAFVDTGHTHYNELLNDGRTVYGAARSTAQIEEDGGSAGLATVCVHDGVPSWRFRALPTPWPAVQIVSPCDLRLATRIADPRHVPRPGAIEGVARLFGRAPDPVVSLDDGASVPMAAGADALWRATVQMDAEGLHDVRVRAGETEDRIEMLVRPADNLPKRQPAPALGHPVHAIGAWPQAGILGTQLGPNRNGGPS